LQFQVGRLQRRKYAPPAPYRGTANRPAPCSDLMTARSPRGSTAQPRPALDRSRHARPAAPPRPFRARAAAPRARTATLQHRHRRHRPPRRRAAPARPRPPQRLGRMAGSDADQQLIGNGERATRSNRIPPRRGRPFRPDRWSLGASRTRSACHAGPLNCDARRLDDPAALGALHHPRRGQIRSVNSGGSIAPVGAKRGWCGTVRGTPRDE
jgi:hypothetical protein